MDKRQVLQGLGVILELAPDKLIQDRLCADGCVIREIFLL